MRVSKRTAPWLFLMPFFVVFFAFNLWPIVRSVVLAFYQTSGPEASTFVGFDNFSFLLVDPDFWTAVKNTAIFAFFSVFLQLPLSLGLAILLDRDALRARNGFRFAFFSPHLMGVVFAALLFTLIFAPVFGIFNQALVVFKSVIAWVLAGVDRVPAAGHPFLAITLGGLLSLGLLRAPGGRRRRRSLQVALVALLLLQPQWGLLSWLGVGLRPYESDTKWLQQAELVMPALVILSLWLHVGYNMIYFLAALQAVDKQLYEAARVDGAGPLRQFWDVTLPGIKPVAVFVMILSTIGSFQLFELAYLLLGGAGPEKSGLTIVMYLFDNGFVNGDLGYASAIGWTLAVIILALAMLQARIAKLGREET